MLIKGITDEDFVNYKKPSMFIAFPSCSFKCEKECGVRCCQNSDLANSKNIGIDIKTVVERYVSNPITTAVVCGGLEPFDSWNDLEELIKELRNKTDDDIVVYTGYNKAEIVNKIRVLSKYKNIIVKFGRFVPDSKERYDEILGIKLRSDNQYAERIGDNLEDN